MARSVHSVIFRVLPSMSPTITLICAIASRNVFFMKNIVTDGRLRRTIYKHITVCSNPKSSRQGGILTVARLPKDVLITTQPVRIFPNDDYLYVEISRANVQYECRMKMARKGDPSRSLDAVSYTHLRAHETPEHLVCR